jgi:hypothetical protein
LRLALRVVMMMSSWGGVKKVRAHSLVIARSSTARQRHTVCSAHAARGSGLSSVSQELNGGNRILAWRLQGCAMLAWQPSPSVHHAHTSLNAFAAPHV